MIANLCNLKKNSRNSENPNGEFSQLSKKICGEIRNSIPIETNKQNQTLTIAMQSPPYPENVNAWLCSSEAPRCSELLDNSTFRRLLHEYTGTPFSEDTCNYLIRMSDKDADGRISRTELTELCSCIRQWTQVFRHYDGDGSGSIDKEELGTALGEMGFRFSPQFVGQLLGNSGEMSREHFIMTCVKLHRFTDQFRERDKGGTGVLTIDFEDFIKVALNCI